MLERNSFAPQQIYVQPKINKSKSCVHMPPSGFSVLTRLCPGLESRVSGEAPADALPSHRAQRIKHTHVYASPCTDAPLPATLWDWQLGCGGNTTQKKPSSWQKKEKRRVHARIYARTRTRNRQATVRPITSPLSVPSLPASRLAFSLICPTPLPSCSPSIRVRVRW